MNDPFRLDRPYLSLLNRVLTEGHFREDRTKVGTYAIFGTQSRYDLTESFPLLTTKKINIEKIIHELLWFLSGDTNIKYLKDNNVSIWDEWADENGDLGPVYGQQWRGFKGLNADGNITRVDQIKNVIKSIKEEPYSRRHIVSAWNPCQVDDMALPPCHTMFQFFVEGEYLSCQLYQRSADLFLGVPFNIASYSLLTMMVANVCGLKPKEFIHTIGDAHIYYNHKSQVITQLNRTPKFSPKMYITAKKDIFDYKIEDFKLDRYNPHAFIKAPIAV